MFKKKALDSIISFDHDLPAYIIPLKIDRSTRNRCGQYYIFVRQKRLEIAGIIRIKYWSFVIYSTPRVDTNYEYCYAAVLRDIVLLYYNSTYYT